VESNAGGFPPPPLGTLGQCFRLEGWKKLAPCFRLSGCPAVRLCSGAGGQAGRRAGVSMDAIFKLNAV